MTFRGSDTDTFQIGAVGSFGLSISAASCGEDFLRNPPVRRPAPSLGFRGRPSPIVDEFHPIPIRPHRRRRGAGFSPLLRVLSGERPSSQRPELTASRNFENPAFERIILGAVMPPLYGGPLAFKSYLRGGFVDLFNYWKAATHPEPRTRWFLRFGGELDAEVSSCVRPYLRADVDALSLRSDDSPPPTGGDGLLFPGAGLDKRDAFAFSLFHRDRQHRRTRRSEYSVRLIGLGFALRSK